MPVNSLYPAYAEINYHSAFAPHVMTIPLKGWSSGVSAGGDVDLWDGTTQGASIAIQAFVDLIRPFFPATVEFDYFFIFSYASPTSDPVVSAGGVLSGVGTNTDPGWQKATQATFTFKTSLGGLSKIVLLDFNSNNNFNPITFPGLTGDALDFVNFVTGGTSFIAGRDNGQPSFFLKISYDLNDALRKQYHMD